MLCLLSFSVVASDIEYRLRCYTPEDNVITGCTACNPIVVTIKYDVALKLYEGDKLSWCFGTISLTGNIDTPRNFGHFEGPCWSGTYRPGWKNSPDRYDYAPAPDKFILANTKWEYCVGGKQNYIVNKAFKEGKPNPNGL